MQGLGIFPLSRNAARGTSTRGPGRKAEEAAGNARAEENAEKVFVGHPVVFAVVVNGRIRDGQRV